MTLSFNSGCYFVADGSSYTPIEASPDLRVLVFTIGVSLVTGILFGLAPALRVSRVSLAPSMKAGTARIAGDAARPGRLPLPKILVASQAALSLLLLVGAGLFVRTLRNLEDQDFGFNRRNVLMVTLGAQVRWLQARAAWTFVSACVGGDDGAARRSLRHAFDDAADFGDDLGRSRINSRTLRAAQRRHGYLDQHVAPQYFETTGIPLLRGRAVGPEDTATSLKVAVVNQTFADHFFPGGDAVGRRVGIPGEEKVEREVVGVVRDTKYHDPGQAPGRMIYLPLSQLSGENLYAT